MSSDKLQVELNDVHLSLVAGSGEVPVLRGVNLRVYSGESVSIVGPSGSGKTTLLMIMAGMEKASSGLVRVCGQDLSRLGEDGLARFRRFNAGIVFQSFHLIPTMTAVENVALPLEFAGISGAHATARASLDAVGLSNRYGHYPSQLSGGEQQRVAIARAFSTRPSLLLADEPTGNLDMETGEKISGLLFDLCQEFGSTFILITHDLDLASRCSRKVQMLDGVLGS